VQRDSYSAAFENHFISNQQLGIETPPSEMQKAQENLNRMNAEVTAIQNIEGRLSQFFKGRMSYEDMVSEYAVPYQISGGQEFVPVTSSLIDNYIERAVRSAEDELLTTTDPQRRIELTRSLVSAKKNSQGRIRTTALDKTVNNVSDGVFTTARGAGDVVGQFDVALEHDTAFNLVDNSKWVNPRSQQVLAVHNDRIKQEVQDGKITPMQGKAQIESLMAVMKESYNLERPTVKMIETEIADRGGDIQAWTIGTQNLAVGSKSVFAKMVDPARINNPGYIEGLIDKHTLTLSSEWAIPGWNKGIAIVKPEGSAETDKAITEKIMGETMIALKKTEIAPSKITDSRLSVNQTQLGNGQRATAVYVYDNNDQIIYTKVYNDVELTTPLTMGQRNELDTATEKKYSGTTGYNPQIFKEEQRKGPAWMRNF